MNDDKLRTSDALPSPVGLGSQGPGAIGSCDDCGQPTIDSTFCDECWAKLQTPAPKNDPAKCEKCGGAGVYLVENHGAQEVICDCQEVAPDSSPPCDHELGDGTIAPGVRVMVVSGISEGLCGTVTGLAAQATEIGGRAWLVELDATRTRQIREDYLQTVEAVRTAFAAQPTSDAQSTVKITRFGDPSARGRAHDLLCSLGNETIITPENLAKVEAVLCRDKGTLTPEMQEALLAIATPAAPVETYITGSAEPSDHGTSGVLLDGGAFITTAEIEELRAKGALRVDYPLPRARVEQDGRVVLENTLDFCRGYVEALETRSPSVGYRVVAQPTDTPKPEVRP